MKKYIKPTAQIVELSVKESLSAVPSGFTATGLRRKAQVTAAYGFTGYRKTSKINAQSTSVQ